MPRPPIVAALLTIVASLAPLATSAGAATDAVPSSLCGLGQPPTVSSIIPADSKLNNQEALNCFAWQQFIGLNWTADTSSCAADPAVGPPRFGEPTTAPVVWETYKEPDEVFLRDAARPPGWCAPKTGSATGTATRPAGRPKRLEHLNKFADAGDVELSSIAQTDPTRSWLTAQSGLLTLYEVRLNEDEFNYIYSNKLYDAAVQQSFVASQGVQLPDGGPASAAYGDVGAIELKAAWLELADPNDWPRFKTSRAVVRYPHQKPRTVTVGLVGLHIIHKTVSGQQFIWATFEHEDNAPSTADDPNPRRQPPYTYHNPDCDPQTDHYRCRPNAVPGRPCTSMTPPAPPNCSPYDAPIQVVRAHPLDTPPASPNNDIVGLNEAVQKMIASQNPDSVFQHYQLVNVLWPNMSTPVPAGAQVPLTCGDATPSPAQEVVANTVIETYLQGGEGGEPDPQPDPCNAGSKSVPGTTCLSCHAFATVASTDATSPLLIGADDGTPQYASDYSFVLSQAQVPPSDDDGAPVAWIGIGLGAAAAAAAVAVTARRRQAGG